ncbi:hypothetical protein [Neomegalonema sp.]|uniref:hypothetical protein n=1 Tax=Neomegalonema sp. TaxID=2039713 RepID=UPI00261D4B57|nr:hypothetical protein [Neomegalonema sp.]MDD2869153.1 hypothetical protein [Neomegalonema sp.]
MNKIFATMIFMMAVPSTVFAQSASSVRVGEIVCIDRLGPINIVGKVVSVDLAGDRVRLSASSGDEKWHAGRKLINLTKCRASKQAAAWALRQGAKIIEAE